MGIDSLFYMIISAVLAVSFLVFAVRLSRNDDNVGFTLYACLASSLSWLFLLLLIGNYAAHRVIQLLSAGSI